MSKMKDTKELVSIVFTKSLHSQLKAEAEKQDISVSALIRKVMTMYLTAKAEKEKEKDQLNYIHNSEDES